MHATNGEIYLSTVNWVCIRKLRQGSFTWLYTVGHQLFEQQSFDKLADHTLLGLVGGTA